MGEISCFCIKALIQCVIKAHAFVQGSKDGEGSPSEVVIYVL